MDVHRGTMNTLIDWSGDPFDAQRLRRQRVRAGLWLTLIFWGSNYVLLTLGTALAANPHLPELTAVRLATSALGLVFCYGIHRLLNVARIRTMRQRLVALAIVAPIAAEAFAWASFFAEAAVDPALSLSNFTWSGAIRTISFWTWFFLAWAGLYLALWYSFDVREEQLCAAELRERAHVAQLRALHSQTNPHFLFNALNSVAALILDRRGRAAEEMVSKLAQFLRMGLAMDPMQKIPLRQEIELQRTYLDIEQLRYQDLRVDFSIPDQLQDALVPALVLQPIVENAVKYGVAGASPPAHIHFTAESDGQNVVLKVTDSGTGGGTAVAGTGIGIANVTQRLRLIYGDRNADVRTTRLDDGRFEAAVIIPMEIP